MGFKTALNMELNIQSTPVIWKGRNLYYSFDITEFRFKGSNINVLDALVEF